MKSGPVRVTLRSEHRGLDECLACFASASEASAHAHCELIELDFADGAIRFQGSALVSMEMRIEGNVVIGEGIDRSVEIITPPGEFLDITNPRWSNGRPQCYRRLSMFRRDAGEIFGDRFVSMDLDVVVGDPLDPLFDRPEDLVLFKGTLRGRAYNGSMMMIRAGCRPDVYEDFNQEAALESGRLFCGSDQAWLMHKLGPNEPVWDDADGVYWFGGAYRTRRDKVPPRVLFFPGNLKPWDVRKIDPFAREHYHLDLMEAA